MSKIYLPADIPLEYKYYQFGNGYIDLFNRNHFNNETVMAYRIYYDYSDDLYTQVWHNFTLNNSIYYPEADVTHNLLSRHDISSLFVCCFITMVCIIFIINVITSFIKKGGLLGGLL